MDNYRRRHAYIEDNQEGHTKNVWVKALAYLGYGTVIGVFIAVIAVLIALFNVTTQNDNKLTFIVNSYLSTEDPVQLDPTWQVASKHWGLPSGASTTPATPGAYTPYYSNEVLTPMTECMWTAQIGWNRCNNDTLENYFKCVKTVFSTELTACEGLATQQAYLYPIRNDYVECVYKKVGANKVQNLTVLDRCADITFWPIYEVIQDADSDYFLGSFNWALLLIVGLTFHVCIVGYASWPLTHGEIHVYHGKPARNDMMGVGVKGSTLQVLIFFIPVFIVSVGFMIICWNYSGNFANQGIGVPATVSTQILVFTAVFAGLVYFVCELAEFWDAANSKNPYSEMSAQPESKNLLNTTGIPVAFQMQVPKMGYYLQPSDENMTLDSLGSQIHAYALYMLKTFQDAYLFDVLTCMGVLGATQHLILAETYEIFFLLITLRLTNMVAARQMYAGYVNFGNKQTGYEDTFKNRAFALAANFAALFNVINLAMLWTNPSRLTVEFGTCIAFFYLGILIPEILKLLLQFYFMFTSNRYFVSKQGEFLSKNAIPTMAIETLVLYQFIVFWDVAIRALFAFIILFSSAPGTSNYVADRHKGLMAFMS